MSALSLVSIHKDEGKKSKILTTVLLFKTLILFSSYLKLFASYEFVFLVRCKYRFTCYKTFILLSYNEKKTRNSIFAFKRKSTKHNFCGFKPELLIDTTVINVKTAFHIIERFFWHNKTNEQTRANKFI